MNRAQWKLVALATASVLSMSIALLAQAPPGADTFVSSACPSTNFGAVNSLAVGRSQGIIIRASTFELLGSCFLEAT